MEVFSNINTQLVVCVWSEDSHAVPKYPVSGPGGGLESLVQIHSVVHVPYAGEVGSVCYCQEEIEIEANICHS